jgi:hypothetical protein
MPMSGLFSNVMFSPPHPSQPRRAETRILQGVAAGEGGIGGVPSGDASKPRVKLADMFNILLGRNKR